MARPPVQNSSWSTGTTPWNWTVAIRRVNVGGDVLAFPVSIRIEGRNQYALSFYDMVRHKIIRAADRWSEPYEAGTRCANRVELMESNEK